MKEKSYKRDNGRDDAGYCWRSIDSLLGEGFDVDFIHYSGSGDIYRALRRSGPDLVWSHSQYCRGPGGQRLNAHALLEAEAIPYLGSPPEVLDLVRSKSALKAAWLGAGVRTPLYEVFRRSPDGRCDLEERVDALRNFPYIVKPLAEGNSRGIDAGSVVEDAASLRSAIRRVLAEFGAGLTEEYLYRYPDAREFTVAMVGNGPSRRVMPAELLRSGGPRGIVTAEDKRTEGVFARSVADPELRRNLSGFALRAFEAAGVRDYARLDMFAANGGFFAIEVNGQPMLPDSWFDACAEGGGFPARSYVGEIVRACLSRLEEPRARAS